jgi:uncharacterized MAPEG superfamily protein
MEATLAPNDLALLNILAWAIALGLAQILVSVLFNIESRGLLYGVGPRDDGPPVTRPVASRTERAHKNFLETFAFFAAAVLIVHALGRASPTTVLGAKVYLWSRVAYLPLYMAGVPWLRTVAWSVSVAGIVMVWMAAVGGF